MHVGGWDLGVRSGSAEIDDLVGRVLGDRCREGLDPPANYSISVEQRSDSVATVLPTLFRGHKALLRTRSLPVLIRGLLANLATCELAGRPGLMWVDADAVVTADGRALLTSAMHRRDITNNFRALQRVGLRYQPVPGVAVDPTSSRLVVSGLSGAAKAADDLAADRDVRAVLVPPGRYPVTGWVVAGKGDNGSVVSPAQGVLRTLSLVTNLDELGPQRALDALASVFAGASAVTVARRASDELLGALGRLAEAG